MQLFWREYLKTNSLFYSRWNHWTATQTLDDIANFGWIKLFHRCFTNFILFVDVNTFTTTQTKWKKNPALNPCPASSQGWNWSQEYAPLLTFIWPSFRTSTWHVVQDALPSPATTSKFECLPKRKHPTPPINRPRTRASHHGRRHRRTPNASQLTTGSAGKQPRTAGKRHSNLRSAQPRRPSLSSLRWIFSQARHESADDGNIWVWIARLCACRCLIWNSNFGCRRLGRPLSTFPSSPFPSPVSFGVVRDCETPNLWARGFEITSSLKFSHFRVDFPFGFWDDSDFCEAL